MPSSTRMARGGPISERQAACASIIAAGRYQPRTKMDETASGARGIDQEEARLMHRLFSVRPIGSNRYEIIAGERRWRAAENRPVSRSPALVREVPDSSALAMALVENSRGKPQPLEEAGGCRRCIRRNSKLTTPGGGGAIGRSARPTTNLLRLLNLQKAGQTLAFSTGKLRWDNAARGFSRLTAR